VLEGDETGSGWARLGGPDRCLREGLIGHVEMRCLQAHLPLVGRLHQGCHGSRHQQRALHRILWLSTEKHLLNIQGQIAEVRKGRGAHTVHPRCLDLATNPGGVAAPADVAGVTVQMQHRGAKSVDVLQQKRHGTVPGCLQWPLGLVRLGNDLDRRLSQFS
jgi:hypothetical protein